MMEEEEEETMSYLMEPQPHHPIPLNEQFTSLSDNTSPVTPKVDAEEPPIKVLMQIQNDYGNPKEGKTT